MDSLNIAMDYDKTYDTDKDMWNIIMELMREAGHNVFMVTYRHPELDYNKDFAVLESLGFACYFTNGKAKKKYMEEEHDIKVDVWIDDNPKSSLEDSAWADGSEELNAWRLDQIANGGIVRKAA